MIKVLVVEDSAVVRDLLVHILHSDPDIEVVGTAGNGEEALKFVKRKRPDLILMDIHMPVMNGLEATRRIMESIPVPTVIVTSSFTENSVDKTFRAMEAGALGVLQKPQGIFHEDYEKNVEDIISAVKLLSEIKVIKRTKDGREEPLEWSPKTIKRKKVPRIDIITIAASTGGPPAIKRVLSELGKDLTVPVLIVQHIAQGFLEGFVNWLGASTGLPLHQGHHGTMVVPGNVYIAPCDVNMGISKRGKIIIDSEDDGRVQKPSASYLFNSVKEHYADAALGVILTGMGKDGAEELKKMRDKGSVTIAQDKETSVVFGMPGEAVQLDAAEYILPLGSIGPKIRELLGLNDN
ncbi:MAG: chemotaxis-specific protein-glutamate methyltransferase CheB [bacterium]